MVIGEVQSITPLGKVEAGRNGEFTISNNDLEIPQELLPADGLLDVTLVAHNDDRFTVHNLTLDIDHRGEVALVPGSTLARGGELAIRHPETQSTKPLPDATQTPEGDEVFDLVLTEVKLQSHEVGGSMDLQPQACGTTYVESLGNRTTYVGSNHSTTSSGFTNTFSYTTGGTATLGVGTTSGGGGWKLGGTSSKASESTTTWPKQASAGHKVRATHFAYGKYRIELCSSGVVWYEARPRYHYGGAATYSAATPPSSYCATYPAGSTFTKQSTSAVTWSAGVKIASKIGIDLTSRGGYSSTVKNSFTFANRKRLCGEWAGPGGTSGRLTVKAP